MKNRSVLYLITALLLCACDGDDLPPPPIASGRTDDGSESGAPEPDLCGAYIGCREACAEDAAGCRIECSEVVPVDHWQCIMDRCHVLALACGANPDGLPCVLLPRCDDDVTGGRSTPTDATGGSSSTAADDDPDTTSGSNATDETSTSSSDGGEELSSSTTEGLGSSEGTTT